jgi:magnesium transporter
MMGVFASIISNNLNIVMKTLTIITIALAVPTMISGFFGMNLMNSFENNALAFPMIVIAAIVLSLVTSFVLIRSRFNR